MLSVVRRSTRSVLFSVSSFLLTSSASSSSARHLMTSRMLPRLSVPPSSLLTSVKMTSSANGPFSNTVPSQIVLQTIQGADAFCFDVDSTVITEEGIDVLADFKGAGEKVAELTKRAMGGDVVFQDALAERLGLIQPSKSDLQQCLAKHPFRLTDGIKELIHTLHAQGKKVYLVSGGFRQMIEPIADSLDIPYHRIYANNLLFHPTDGTFSGFDTKEPTSKDGGKAAVVRLLRDAHGYQRIVMVGDGVTDLQARPPATLFIGFGGVVVREKVKDGADWFITDFKDLISALKQ